MHVPSKFTQTIDRLVESISPNAALKRHVARQKLNHFRYEGGQNSRYRGKSAGTQQSPESSTYQRDRFNMLLSARDLSENGELASAVLGKFERHVCGNLTYQANTGNDSIDGEHEEYFGDWCKGADYTGRHSFRTLVGLGLRGGLVDGDSGFGIMREDTRLSLNGIEGDRIGGAFPVSTDEFNAGGVLLDGRKRPRAYQIFDRSMWGSYSNPVEVPAHLFIHLFKPRRFDEYHGVSAFHSVLDTSIDIKDIVAFEKMAVKWASAQAGVVTGEFGGEPDSETVFTGGNQAQSGAAMRLEEILPGRINYVGTDGDFTAFKHDRPGMAWQGFLQFLIKLYSIGMDLPYGFVFEMAGLTGPAARFESKQAQRTFEWWQLLLQEKMLDRVKNLVIANGIAHDGLRATPNWMRGRWQWPAHPTIDVGRESKANVEENQSGLLSMGTICAEKNLDGKTERRKIASELRDWLDLAEEFRIPPEMMLKRFEKIHGGGEKVVVVDDRDDDDDDDDIDEPIPSKRNGTGAAVNGVAHRSS